MLFYSIKEKLRTGEMHVRGDQWPFFLYADLAYDPDDPWNGLLRNQLLVYVSRHPFTFCQLDYKFSDRKSVV